MTPDEWYTRVGAVVLADTMGQVTPEEKEQAAWLLAIMAPRSVATSMVQSMMAARN